MKSSLGWLRYHTVFIVAGLVLGAALAATNSLAAEDAGAPANTVDVAQEVKAEPVEGKQENCTWGCLRWDKLCNVDPRGVYKCRRMCGEFGEICE